MSHEPPIANGFHEEFDFNGRQYIAHIKHYTVVSEDEIINYHVSDGEFLVHLFSLDGCKSFNIYLDDNLIWKTSSSIMVEQELVDVLGFVIDMREFYE